MNIDADTFVGGAKEIEPEQTPSTALVAISQARRALEVASTLDDVKDIRDRAEAMRAYAKQAQYSLEIQNRCAELKLRAERKAGTLLSESTVKGGARHKSHDGTYERRSVLEDLGISKMQSSRWQTVSTIPDDIFEQHVAKITASERELTSASVIRIATLLKKNQSAQFPQQRPTDRTDHMPDGGFRCRKKGRRGNYSGFRRDEAGYRQSEGDQMAIDLKRGRNQLS